MDITQLILDDHHEQRRLFAILEEIGRTDTAALSAVWARLGAFLELHAAAEEAIFYPALLQAGLAARRQTRTEGETIDFAGVPAVDKDPESYVSQAEHDLAPPTGGALNIGSLKGQ